jgi:7-cyano-7-deazaguanine synthase
LASGGVDSSILLALEARKRREVFPVFVRAGFRFEKAQREALDRFLKKLRLKNIRPVTELRIAASDFFPKSHWALSGRKIPPAGSPDGSCYLPGWNLLLLAPALTYAAQQGIPAVVLGHITHNPYPDGQPDFFRQFERLGKLAFERKIRIERPFERLGKEDVLKKGRGLPLEATLTCIDPKRGAHCGACHKCTERHRGFVKSGMADPTRYVREVIA